MSRGDRVTVEDFQEELASHEQSEEALLRRFRQAAVHAPGSIPAWFFDLIRMEDYHHRFLLRLYRRLLAEGDFDGASRRGYVRDDEMAAYGVHPREHERLVRCHNPGRFTAKAPEEPVVSPASRADTRPMEHAKKLETAAKVAVAQEQRPTAVAEPTSVESEVALPAGTLTSH